MSKPLTITRPRAATFLGVPTNVYEVRVAGAHGERVMLTEWLGDQLSRGLSEGVAPAKAGEVTAIHCKGDPMKRGAFERFSKETLASRDDAERWARTQLEG